jgi:ketosteroid isomerase-like protein
MNSVNRTLLAIAFLLVASPAIADTETEITTALDYFAEVWNEGDLEAIRGYYHQDFVLVTDGGSIALGQRIDDLKAIAQAGEDRGVLEYSQVRVKALEKKHALAYGELHLEFKDGSAINTWFTTVYVKTPFGWKAILTHN